MSVRRLVVVHSVSVFSQAKAGLSRPPHNERHLDGGGASIGDQVGSVQIDSGRSSRLDDDRIQVEDGPLHRV